MLRKNLTRLATENLHQRLFASASTSAPKRTDRMQVATNMGLPRGIVFRGAAQFGHSSALQAAKASPEFLIRSLRAEDSGSRPGKTTITGCAVPYERISGAAGAIPELFKQGCFRKSLSSQPNIAVMFNFRSDMILGKTANSTAMIIESDGGLEFEVLPPVGASWAEGLLVSLARGDINGAAVACVPTIQRVEQRNGERVTVVHEAALVAVSVTAFPEFDSPLTVTSESAAARASDRAFLRSVGIEAGRPSLAAMAAHLARLRGGVYGRF